MIPFERYLIEILSKLGLPPLITLINLGVPRISKAWLRVIPTFKFPPTTKVLLLLFSGLPTFLSLEITPPTSRVSLPKLLSDCKLSVNSWSGWITNECPSRLSMVSLSSITAISVKAHRFFADSIKVNTINWRYIFFLLNELPLARYE